LLLQKDPKPGKKDPDFDSISYFCQNFFCMETTKKSTGLYWLLFFASVAAFFLVYKVGGGYCSMVLPFNCTFLAKAMDLM